MRVKELIEKLQALDPELMVVRDGYEGGVNEANYLDEVTVALHVNEEWYYGDHDVLHKADEHPNHERIKAVRIW